LKHLGCDVSKLLTLTNEKNYSSVREPKRERRERKNVNVAFHIICLKNSSFSFSLFDFRLKLRIFFCQDTKNKPIGEKTLFKSPMTYSKGFIILSP